VTGRGGCNSWGGLDLDRAGGTKTGRVLADAAYVINTEFRDGLTDLELRYVVGVQSTMAVWEPGQQPPPAKPRTKMGRPSHLLMRQLRIRFSLGTNRFRLLISVSRESTAACCSHTNVGSASMSSKFRSEAYCTC
jgi:SRSO17 transposase